MSLLVDLAANALDPAYAEAAARHGSDQRRSVRGRLMLVAGVAAAALLIALAGQQAHARAPAAARARGALVAAVDRQTRAVASLSAQVTQLQSATEALRSRGLAGSGAGASLAAQVAAQDLAAGAIPVVGPGVFVRLADASGATHNQVQDRDLQAVVNALWAAGAEAIAINGERLTAQSAIRAAGDAILVDLQPVDPPYVVSAIGDPVGVETAFADSPAAARMRSYAQLYGLGFRYARVRSLRLPAAAQEPLRYARPVQSSRPKGAP